MEKHCVSLEIAKELKEARWTKETEFWWLLGGYEGDSGNKYWVVNKKYLAVMTKKQVKLNEGLGYKCYPAPLATEILEELPDLRISKGDNTYLVIDDEGSSLEVDKSLPNALAKMWLYLKKKGLLGGKK